MKHDGLELTTTDDGDDGGDGDNGGKASFVATSTQYTNQDGLVIVDREVVFGEFPPDTPRFVVLIPPVIETVPNIGTAQFPPPGAPPLCIKLEACWLEAAVREAESEYQRLQDDIRPKLKQAIFTGNINRANANPLPEGFKFDPDNNGQPPLRL